VSNLSQFIFLKAVINDIFDFSITLICIFIYFLHKKINKIMSMINKVNYVTNLPGVVDESICTNLVTIVSR
jgi:hypothetical protein